MFNLLHVRQILVLSFLRNSEVVITNKPTDLFIVDVRGETPRQLVSRDASFSPDGEWIVYSSDEDELDLANIFVIPVAGGDSIKVTDWAGYDGAPSWLPDGNCIVFESYAGDPDDSPGTTLWLFDAP